MRSLMAIFRLQQSPPHAVANDDPSSTITVVCAPVGACDDQGDILWPDDPDEVPAWRTRLEEWAAITGTPIPMYRTKREMECQLARCTFAAPVDPPWHPRAIMAPPFSPDDAAAGFLAWLRDAQADDDTVGEYTAAELTSRYIAYCEETECEVGTIDSVKVALATLPGVYREKTGVRVKGKRSRQVRWIIDVAPASIVPHGARDDSWPVQMAA